MALFNMETPLRQMSMSRGIVRWGEDGAPAVGRPSGIPTPMYASTPNDGVESETERGESQSYPMDGSRRRADMWT
jgi:hypothetical protein